MPASVLAERTATVRPVPADDDQVGTSPQCGDGRSADGRRWELLTSRTGVAVTTPAGPLAEAQVAEERDRVVVDFWSDFPGLPEEIGTHLVDEAFAHPAVRAHRPILVALPRGESTVLQQVQAHLDGARSRVAGVTCLVEGRVRGGAPAVR